MGFYIHEIGEHEGTSMTENLFSNEAFKQTLYGEHYASIFQTFNTHVKVPKPAHDGLMTSMFGTAGEAFMGAILSPGALGCPGIDNDPYQGLMTECKTHTSDWVTSWLWTCPTRDFLLPYIGDSTNIYVVQFSAAYPGPDQGLLPDLVGAKDCYESGQGKSCHIVGQSYLFGEATHQGVAQTAEQIQFGIDYRTVYGDVIKNGSGQTALTSWTDSNGLFNKLDIGQAIEMINPYPVVCQLFDQIQQYGNI